MAHNLVAIYKVFSMKPFEKYSWKIDTRKKLICHFFIILGNY